MDIVVRWAGSCHDQTIFEFQKFQIQTFTINWLMVNGEIFSLIVADNEYKNTNHIVTPFINPRENIVELYNESIIRTRNPVERAYGVLNEDSQFYLLVYT